MTINLPLILKWNVLTRLLSKQCFSLENNSPLQDQILKNPAKFRKGHT